ncbi:hypothetical protein Tco_0676740 [Tanacetum coccineum]
MYQKIASRVTREGRVDFGMRLWRTRRAKIKATCRRTYDMVNEKWKTVCLNVAQFCGVYANVMRRGPTSGAGVEDYIQKALLDYEAEYGVPFTLRPCWEV